MNSYTFNHLMFSCSGEATILVILSHGAWKEKTGEKWWQHERGDGMFTIPGDGNDLDTCKLLHFYSKDSEYTVGGKAANSVLIPSDAEFKRKLPLDWQTLKNNHMKEKAEIIQTCISGDEIKNYALTSAKNRGEVLKLFQQHKQGMFDKDIDLVIVDPDYGSKIHLSDVFETAETFNNGNRTGYLFYHYCACRSDRTNPAALVVGGPNKNNNNNN